MSNRANNYSYASIFSKEMRDFLDMRISQGRSGKEGYTILMLDKYLLETGLNEKSLSPDCVDGWLTGLAQKLSANTRVVYVSHYSQFAKYLHSLDFTAYIPERPIGEKRYAPYIFSLDELDRLFSSADQFSGAAKANGSFTPLDFPMVLRILYGCGMRLDEVLLLIVSDIDADNGLIRIRNAKGQKDRLVPMESSLAAIISKFMSVRCKGLHEDMLLFRNRRSERHSQAWARSCFLITLKQAGIERYNLPRYSRNICLHCLRHTFAVNSFRKRANEGFDSYADAPLLSVFMGHDELIETQTYLHMTAEIGKDILERTSAYTIGIFPEVPE